MSVSEISPQTLHRLNLDGNKPFILDVRTPAEYEMVHLENGRLIPLDQLKEERLKIETGLSKESPVYLLCRSGTRARSAAQTLGSMGYKQCHVIEGGIESWMQSGFPVVRGERSVISLERQVRIAAGLLVLTGVILSLVVHPGWIGLSAFVGAGLIFAGVTDWCGMGILLSKMPWNQASKKGS